MIISTQILESVPQRLLDAGIKHSNYVVVSDDKVFRHYGMKLVKAFERCGIPLRSSNKVAAQGIEIAPGNSESEEIWNAQVAAFQKPGLILDIEQVACQALHVYVFNHGEPNKTRETKDNIEDFMLANFCTKDTVILALGGGVVGDLTGYLAATFMYGVPFIQIPTSTMAMIDSSVGGKTALNPPAGKNLIGAFYQPRFVFAGMEILRSLSRREVAEGLAEAIKMGCIQDAELFERMAAEPIAALDLKPDLLEYIIHKAVWHKARIVAIDEKETGLRGTLNFGHTIGHAIEALVSPKLLHGECVAIGCVAEAHLAYRMGHLAKETVPKIRACFDSYGLPIGAPAGLSLQAIMNKMAVDKKNVGKTIRCTIITDIGKSIDHPVPVERTVMESVVQELLDNYAQGVSLRSAWREPKSGTGCC